MKALVYTGAETLAYRDVPDPAPVADEALIRVESVGICGSDMHAFLGHDDRRPAPLILGHEVRIGWRGASLGRHVADQLSILGQRPKTRLTGMLFGTAARRGQAKGHI